MSGGREKYGGEKSFDYDECHKPTHKAIWHSSGKRIISISARFINDVY
jgi:hypothetical protein